jgi:hypothetical protein
MYTVKTPYEKEVKELEESCKKLNLECKAYPIKNLKNWVKNTQQKGNVCLKALEEFDCDIVWLDADAVVFQYPILFDELNKRNDFNICIHKHDPRWKKRPTGEMLSGTIYFKNNNTTKDMIKKWIDRNKEVVEWDQYTLQDVIENNKQFKTIQLPVEYVKIRPKSIENIFNMFKSNKNLFIGHKQRSRKYKRIIGK